MIGFEQKVDCENCERHSHVVDMKCYGCAVRFFSRLTKVGRAKLYEEIQRQFSAELKNKLMSDVRAYVLGKEEREATRVREPLTPPEKLAQQAREAFR